MPALPLVFRCHFVEQNGVTIIAYSDRFGGRGQGKFIVAAGITKNSSAVPAMMLEQGKKSRQLKMSRSRPSVDQCHTQPKQPAPIALAFKANSSALQRPEVLSMTSQVKLHFTERKKNA